MSKLTVETLDSILKTTMATGSDRFLATMCGLNRLCGQVAHRYLYYAVDLRTIEQALAFMETMSLPDCGGIVGIDLTTLTCSLQLGFDVGKCSGADQTRLRSLLQKSIPVMCFENLNVYFSEYDSRALEVLSVPGILYPALHLRLISVEAGIRTVCIHYVFC
jgi:hypothetical protein